MPVRLTMTKPVIINLQSLHLVNFRGLLHLSLAATPAIRSNYVSRWPASFLGVSITCDIRVAFHTFSFRFCATFRFQMTQSTPARRRDARATRASATPTTTSVTPSRSTFTRRASQRALTCDRKNLAFEEKVDFDVMTVEECLQVLYGNSCSLIGKFFFARKWRLSKLQL